MNFKTPAQGSEKFRVITINRTGSPIGRIESIVDPNGHTFSFEYRSESYGYSAETPAVSDTFFVMTRAVRPDGSFVSYDYTLEEQEKDITPQPAPAPGAPAPTQHYFFQVNLSSIADPRGNVYRIFYQYDLTKFNYSQHTDDNGKVGGYYHPPGQPRMVSHVSLPDGSVSSFNPNLINTSSSFPGTSLFIDYGDEGEGSPGDDEIPYLRGQRFVAITDAEGNTRVYEYTNPDLISMSEFATYFVPTASASEHHARSTV